MLVVQALRDLLERVRSVVLIILALARLLDDGQVNGRYLCLDKLEFCVELSHDIYPALVCVDSILRTVVLRGYDLLSVFDYLFEVYLTVKRDSL